MRKQSKMRPNPSLKPTSNSVVRFQRTMLFPAAWLER